jgi:hypothetical protein
VSLAGTRLGFGEMLLDMCVFRAKSRDKMVQCIGTGYLDGDGLNLGPVLPQFFLYFSPDQVATLLLEKWMHYSMTVEVLSDLLDLQFPGEEIFFF